MVVIDLGLISPFFSTFSGALAIRVFGQELIFEICINFDIVIDITDKVNIDAESNIGINIMPKLFNIRWSIWILYWYCYFLMLLSNDIDIGFDIDINDSDDIILILPADRCNFATMTE